MKMASTKSDLFKTRLEQIPVLYCRGTFHDVGYSIGRQFKGMIADLIDRWLFFTKIVIPAYKSEKGKAIYDASLALCKHKFPNYVAELEGMATGAEQPFYKLFLLHLESIIASPDIEDEIWAGQIGGGCTSLILNSDADVILAHTEDTCPEFLNNIYIVNTEIIGNKGEILEKWSTLTYAGHLAGFTMGYNAAGLVYSINTLYPLRTQTHGTPRTFITRAILGASNLQSIIRICRDKGTGVSDGFSLNVTFAKQEGSPVFHNIEVAPPKDSEPAESELSVLTLSHGDFHAHCNKYLRLNVPELPGIARNSSVQRHKAIGRHLKPTNVDKVKDILSDQTDREYPIFRHGGKPDYVVTVAVGILDIRNRKWSLYTKAPSSSHPVVVLPMDFN